MTGLYNRRSFDEDCRNLLSEKKKPPITVLAMDLTNLKACNDKRGHITDDRYIFEAATLINDISRKYCRCYRVGGGEFCCILLDMPRSKFEEEMKNYTQQVQKKSLEITDSHFGIATGYTFFNPQKDASLEEVRVRVDAAMYANKAEMKSSYYSRLETMD